MNRVDVPSNRNFPVRALSASAIGLIVSLFVNGYSYGRFDQVVHIPLTKAWLDPSLFTNDIGIQTFKQLYWTAALPLSKTAIWLLGGDIPAAFLALYLVSVFFFAVSLCALGRSLGGATLPVLVAMLLLVPARPLLASLISLDLVFTSRICAYPLLVFAAALLFRGHVKCAAAVAGLATDFHPLMGFTAAAVLFSAQIACARRLGPINIILGLCCYLLAAAPFLALRPHMPMVMLDPEWLRIAKESSGPSFFLGMEEPKNVYYQLTVLFAGLALALRTLPPHRFRLVLGMAAGSLGTCLLAYLVETLYPHQALISLVLQRSAYLPLIILHFLLALKSVEFLQTGWRGKRLSSATQCVLLLAALADFGGFNSLFIPLGTCAGVLLLAGRRWPWFVAAVLGTTAIALVLTDAAALARLCLVAGIILAATLGLAWLHKAQSNHGLSVVAGGSVVLALLALHGEKLQRSLRAFEISADGYSFQINDRARDPLLRALADAGRWVKTNTAIDAVVLHSPALSAFRVYSDRASFVNAKDASFAVMNRQFAMEWAGRMRLSERAADLAGKPDISLDRSIDYVLMPRNALPAGRTPLYSNERLSIISAR